MGILVFTKVVVDLAGVNVYIHYIYTVLLLTTVTVQICCCGTSVVDSLIKSVYH